MKRERNGRETETCSLWAAEKPRGEIFVIPSAKAGIQYFREGSGLPLEFTPCLIRGGSDRQRSFSAAH